MTREMSVAGAFYPQNVDELESSINYFNELIEQHFNDKIFSKNLKALIVPHAGYVYSGFTANIAYRNILKKPKRFVVIGPSHRVSLQGVSLVDFDSYQTPLGDIQSDSSYALYLKSNFSFLSVPTAHQEHSTEVQFPFIKHYFKDTPIVELVYGQNADLDDIIEDILQDDDTFLIISTDLSHFYNQEDANILDNYCIKGIENLDTELLVQGEACGMQGVKSLIKISKKLGLYVKSIDYRTSGDITGDMSRVVGYFSALVY